MKPVKNGVGRVQNRKPERKLGGGIQDRKSVLKWGWRYKIGNLSQNGVLWGVQNRNPVQKWSRGYK